MKYRQLGRSGLTVSALGMGAQGSTGRRTVLEPVMVAAINLDQFAAAGPAITWLLNFRRTLFAGYPETGFDHE